MSNPQNWLAFHKCQDFLHSLLCWDYKSKKIMLEVIPVGLWKRRNHTCLNFPVGNSQVDCLASFLIPESGRKFNKNKVYKFTRNTNISPLYNNCRPHFTSATGVPNQFCCHFLFFTGAARQWSKDTPRCLHICCYLSVECPRTNVDSVVSWLLLGNPLLESSKYIFVISVWS